MNICFLSYQAVMLLKGGPRTQMLQTKKFLEKLGVNISLFQPWEDFQPAKFDLVHIFGGNIGTYHVARELFKLGVPYVVSPIFFSLHAPFTIRTALNIDKGLQRLIRGSWTDYGMLADICKWSSLVLPNTHKEAGLLARGMGVPEDKISIIPNGVEERFYNALPDRFTDKYGIKDFILNVGHVGPGRKNVIGLIRSLNTIEREAVIIGRIENNAMGRTCLEEAKKNPRIRIIDSIPNDSELLASAYAACEVFALPSLFETPGIAALEAGLAGAKIVITKYGGTDEYFGEYAEYVEPSSVKSIRDGINLSLQKKKEGVLRENLRKEFTWENIAAQTLRAYENFLSEQK